MKSTLILLALSLAASSPDAAAVGFRGGVGLRTAPGVDVARKPAAPRALDLQRAGFTPYDRYLGSVRTVFANLDRRPATVADACRLMRTAHAFRYVARDPYRADSPALTASRRAGDCKAKALWLYDHLGDARALYVIGKLTPRSKSSHAWVYWRWEGRWWILDPTHLKNPIAADSVGRSRYVPYYSFAPGVAYRHPATHLMMFAQNVAAQRKR